MILGGVEKNVGFWKNRIVSRHLMLGTVFRGTRYHNFDDKRALTSLA